MDSTKPWYTSKTIWASLVGALATLASLFGINIADLSSQLGDQILGVVTLIGTVVAIFGRVTARAVIAPNPPGVNSSKMYPSIVAALLLPALGLGAMGFGLTSCAEITVGADSVVVNAERTTALAVDTFDSFLQFEYSNRAQLAAVSPGIHTYAEVIRRNGQQWLMSARTLTRAYKEHRTAENKANLETAIAVLQTAITQAQMYLAKGR